LLCYIGFPPPAQLPHSLQRLSATGRGGGRASFLHVAEEEIKMAAVRSESLAKNRQFWFFFLKGFFKNNPHFADFD
jgi:hypothetical protein